MNKLTKEKRIQVISALVEGNSIRATCRMTDVAKAQNVPKKKRGKFGYGDV
jgi:hypothetical protein